MFKIILSLVLFLATLATPQQAFSSTLAIMNNAQFELNRVNPEIAYKHQLGLKILKQQELIMKCSYNFATQGGAIGTLFLLDEFGKACTIPNKAIVRDGIIDVTTTITSGGSPTIAFGTGQSATDLKTATAIASLTGLVATTPVGTAATAIKMTADRKPLITIATATVTAGKFNVIIRYEMSE